jgi:putative FmdB family regulatory protein
MPMYDYQCANCGKKFSVHMTITEHDKRKARCPKCGRSRLRRRIESFFAITGKKS